MRGKQPTQLRKPLVGMEISPSAIRMARLEKGVGGWRLLLLSEGRIPGGSLRLSLKEQNILDQDSFLAAVQEAVDGMGGYCSRIGLSLPDEVIKVFIQDFQELPAKREKIQQMMAWWLEKKLRTPMKEIQIAYQVLDRLKSGKKRVLISVCFRRVLKEYENLLRELNVGAVVVRPAGLNRINFFGPGIPGRGTVGFYGLFGNYFNLSILQDGRMIYYQGVRSGADSSVFMYHMDMAINHCRSLGPHQQIDKLYTAYEGPDNFPLHEWLTDLVSARVERLRGDKLLAVDRTTDKWMARYQPQTIRQEMVQERFMEFTAAVGAAQSLQG